MSIENKLSTKHIVKILDYLKAEPKIESNGTISSKTVCHNGIGNGKRKLVYYENSKLFVCYTDCPEDFFGVIKLVEKAKKVGRSEAVGIIEGITGIFDDYISWEEGFEQEEEYSEDLDYIKVFQKPQEEKYEVVKYDSNLLDSFYNFYHKSFIDDHITIKSMKKFNIKFDVDKNRIIIPHYHHEDGSLVAIRCRNLNEELVEMGLKYTPIRMNDKNGKKRAIASKTGAYLYGLNVSAEAVKKNKIVILFEAEKSPMQMYSYFGENSVAVATMGSNLTHKQVEILLSLGVEEVVIAYDKEYKVYGDKEDKLYRKKLRKRLVDKLLPHFKVSVIYDREDLIGYKDSPTDHGVEIFKKLFRKRFYIIG